MVLGLFLSGCDTTGLGTALNTYDQQKNAVTLGDSLDQALPRLNSMQSSVQSQWLRPADQYLESGTKFYIHYQRTGWVEDGLNTDDEFTPYIFANSKLVAIGWVALGGARTAGDANAAAAFNQQRSQALMSLSNSLLQPQTTTRSNSSSSGTFQREVTSGMNKVCFYNTISGLKAYNTSSTSICPIAYPN